MLEQIKGVPSLIKYLVIEYPNPNLKEISILDTPGFSSFYMQDWECEHLAEFYPEFEGYLGGCRFPDCRHRTEPECAVRQAVEEGEISQIRYDNYRKIFDEIWEYQKNNPKY